MERREYIKAAVVASSGFGLSGCISGESSPDEGTDSSSSSTDGESTPGTVSSGGRLEVLSFYSPASQVSANSGPLGDEYAVVRAEDTAVSIDTTDSQPYMYGEGDRPPLASEDGSVVGFGSTEFVSDSNGGFEHDNEEFFLNAIEMKSEGDTVLWDEGHDQYWSQDRYTVLKGYAEEAGYTIDPTSSLSSDLPDADSIVITSPSASFSGSELDALVEFVDRGGAVFLMDQSDFQGHDETGNLNEIAEALGVGFRFNSDQINDASENAGSEFVPKTSNFVGPSGYFDRRDSSIEAEGVSISKDETYEVPITEVSDGDTVNVVFEDSSTDTIRLLGIDTPEVNPSDERMAEWSGIDDSDHLQNWAEMASEFARERLADETVRLEFDQNEPVRGNYGRILAFIYYDSTGDGEYDTNFNLEAVEEGYARAYSSGLARHDEFAAAEQDALESKRGLWGGSDLEGFSEFRNSPVEELFFPNPTSVEGGKAVVNSEPTSTPSGAPLVSVDEQRKVAAVSAHIMSEDYEKEEGYAVDTSGYDNYTFLTNLAYGLSEKGGDVFFEGGHRQFNTEGSLTSEDAAYYGRHLEGFGRRLRQVNTLPETLPEVEAASLIISPPASGYTESELEAVRDFVQDGGSVVLVGDSRSENIENLNEIAQAVGSGVGFTGDGVTDPTNNVSEPNVVETSNFVESFSFFSEFR